MKDIKERFLSKVFIKESEECWLWTGAVTSSGYGNFSIQHKSILAHRFAYILFKGGITEGKLILHRCNVKLCCNPSHLYEGTDGDNTTDKMRDCPISFAVANARLYAGEIWLIRKLREVIGYSGNGRLYKFPSTFVAKMFKTNQATILNIWNSKSYICREGYYV